MTPGTARGLAELLARRLGGAPGGSGDGVTVAELRRTLLPYPRCREALGLASKAEYDVGLLRLLADPDLLRPEEEGLRDAVERELASPEPGLGVLDDWAATSLRPGARLRTAPDDAGPAATPDDGPGARGGATADPSPDRPDPPGDSAPGRGSSPPAGGERRRDPGPDGSRPGTPGVTGWAGTESEGCRSCGHELPEREGVRFCPHCGTDQRTPRCPECREPQERGWRYCPFCGSENDG